MENILLNGYCTENNIEREARNYRRIDVKGVERVKRILQNYISAVLNSQLCISRHSFSYQLYMSWGNVKHILEI